MANRAHNKALQRKRGKKGKCSNERRITCASNVGKTMERIVNNRAKNRITITDMQAGGKVKRSTTDHLLILKEIMQIQKTRKEQLYMAYLDVTKAYDKAWLDGIMYAMPESGLKGPLWNTIRKFNRNLKAQIKKKMD